MKKIFFEIILILICLSLISIYNNDFNAKAANGEDIYLDLNYIRDISEKLSNVTYIAYNTTEIHKGRGFGTKGEHHAAKNIIAMEMTNLSLYDPVGTGDPYLDRIKNFDCKLVDGWVAINTRGSLELTKKYVVTDKELNINISSGNLTNLTPIIDCYITPLNNSSFTGESYEGLKIISTDNYTCTDDYVGDVEIPIAFVNYPLQYNYLPALKDKAFQIMRWHINDFLHNKEDNIDYLMKQEFQLKYEFNFSEIDCDDNETFPTFLEHSPAINESFVFFEEYKRFNPENPNLPSMEIGDEYNILHPWIYEISATYNSLLERAWYECYGDKLKGIIYYDYTNESYNAAEARKAFHKILINGSDGKNISDNIENYRIDFNITQNYNTSIESYNVIGQINGINPSLNEHTIVGCLYDSVWCQGTTDSATGVGIMLAVAKYFQDHNITPKYNVRFIAYGAEEAGLRGAYHYEGEFLDDKINWVIDLNQLGYNQSDVLSRLNLAINDIKIKDIIQTISDKTDYSDRVNDGTNLNVIWTPWGSMSDDYVFATAKYLRPLRDSRNKIKTVMFLKDGGWYRHHRSGMNFSEGDSMKYYNPVDVALTAELVWNITKYVTCNPDCWFESITHELWDSPDDNNTIPDYVNVTYTINTSFPHDNVKIKGILYHNLNQYIEEREYIITPEKGKQDYINFSLPNNAAINHYAIRFYLFNSTGDINDIVDNPYNTPRKNKKYSNHSYIRDNIIIGGNNDLIGSSEHLCSGTQTAQAGTVNPYTTSTNDINSDELYYQFEYGNQQQGYTYSPWIGPYNSGQNCTNTKTWTTTGNMTVRARARDQWLSPNQWTNWTEPLNVTVQPGANLVNPPSVVLVNSSHDFQSQTYGFNPVNWTWNWNDQGISNYTANATKTYNETGSYTINLTIRDNSNNNYSFNSNIQVVKVLSNFSTYDDTKKPTENITFIDSSISKNTITNWTWDFGDGNTSYDQYPTHNYTSEGIYNVTLTVTDNQTNNHTSYNNVYVDSTIPDFIAIYHSTSKADETMPFSYYMEPVGYSDNVTINVDFYDNISGIETVKINVTYPNGTSDNFTMTVCSNGLRDYNYVFNDTWQIGYYTYKIWSSDKANNSNTSNLRYFYVDHLSGYSAEGKIEQNINDRITGSVITVDANGTADSIKAYIYSNFSTIPKTKCMIYRQNDSTLLGTTEEITYNTGDYAEWITYNFSDPKPQLDKNTQYVISCWSNDTCYLYYDNTFENDSRYKTLTYGSSPNPINWTGNETKLYSIYCDYNTKPEINSITDNPDTIGFGYNVTINTTINDFGCGSNLKINVTYPDNTSGNYSMTFIGDDTYQYEFFDTWLAGQYNYTIWAVDNQSGINSSSDDSFNVSANASIKVCTIKDVYGDNETINLTDPPTEKPPIGYELLDENQTLHIWNNHNSYYFNTSNGIQFSNHKDEYWTQNVLMLGYYNNDSWNLMYRTDELNGFTKNVTSDNETFVNATLWKDLNYQGYDFRLAIRYNLGLNDPDLSVLPYIKNIDDEDIPYVLGFGWEMKDIKIANVTNDNYLRIFNGTGFEDIRLNQSLDNSYTNLSNNTVIRLICDNPPTYHLMRDLYLYWDKNLTYKVTVKSRSGQYNAPVSLFIRIGTLNVSQEKSTILHWLDSDDWLGISSSELDSHCGDSGGHNLSEALDGADYWYNIGMSEYDFIIDLGESYTIKKFRGRSYRSSDPIDIDIYVSDNKSNWGNPVVSGISSWQDTASWQVVNLTSYVQGRYVKVIVIDTEHLFNNLEWGGCMGPPYATIFDIFAGLEPVISDPYPSDGATGICISPTLNITVVDAEGDNMNITWYSNFSGSWQVINTTNNVSNGTYSHVFSNASVNGQWWYWKVNVTDISNNTATSPVYKFYTGNQSKIMNLGSTDIRGYLLLQVEYYNSTTSNWTLADETVDEITLRTISSNEQLGLDTIFNGLVNTSNLIESFGNGTYRILARFRNRYGNTLVCDNNTSIETTYEFSITSS